jgi:hypothetical protein
MRNLDCYISMTYRDICAVEYHHAQYGPNNIKDLQAKLRGPFI